MCPSDPNKQKMKTEPMRVWELKELLSRMDDHDKLSFSSGMRFQRDEVGVWKLIHNDTGIVQGKWTDNQ